MARSRSQSFIVCVLPVQVLLVIMMLLVVHDFDIATVSIPLSVHISVSVPAVHAKPLSLSYHHHHHHQHNHQHPTTSLDRLRGLRGGAGIDNSRGLSSFGTKRQPSSFSSSSTSTTSSTFRNPNPNTNPNSNSNSNSNIQVTDVTNEMKSSEREETKEAIDAFLSREDRNSFITRVYSILTVQLLMVAASVLAFGRYPSMTVFMMTKGKFGEYGMVWYCIVLYSIVYSMWYWCM